MIKLKPAYAFSCYESRGVAKTRIGKHREALKDFDTAIGLRPDYALAYYNRGVSKALLGQGQDAIKDCDTAVQLNPYNAEVYFGRGIA